MTPKDTSTPFEVKTVRIPDLKAYLDKMHMEGFEIVSLTFFIVPDELAIVVHKYSHRYEVI